MSAVAVSRPTRYVIDRVAYDLDNDALNIGLLQTRFNLGGDWAQVAEKAEVSLSTLWRARCGQEIGLAALLRVIRTAGVPFAEVMRPVEKEKPATVSTQSPAAATQERDHAQRT